MSLDDAHLRCEHCGHTAPVTEAWLQVAKARQGSRLSSFDIAGLLGILHRCKCTACAAFDPVLLAYVDGALQEFTSSELASTCAACGIVIPAARLAAVPGTRHCTSCQAAAEQGIPVIREALGVCKRCGADLVLRVTKRKAPIRYFLGCERYPKCHYSQPSPSPD